MGEKSDAITARLITSIFSPYRNVGTNLPHVAMLVREHCLRMQLCSCRRPHRQHNAPSINAVCFLVNASRAFLPRDATLAPYMLSACVCLSVCLSVAVFTTATAMWLQPEINVFIFLRGCTRSQPITMQESMWAWSTGCDVIVYCYFHVFWLKK